MGKSAMEGREKKIVLYHGTDASNVASIRKEGLKSWLYGEDSHAGTLTPTLDFAARYDKSVHVPIHDEKTTYPVILQFELDKEDYDRYIKAIGHDEFGLNEPLPGRFLKYVIKNPKTVDNKYYIAKKGIYEKRASIPGEKNWKMMKAPPKR